MKLSGWSLVGWCSVALALMALALLSVDGTGEEGVRAVVRNSARTSVVLFVLAYAASSLCSFWRGPATKWLLANRRYVGVSFAASHTLHLAALVALYRISPEFRDNLDATTIVGGGLAYVFLYAITLTSFDRSAAWLGRRGWKALHTTGMHYIWFIFFISYLPRALQAPAYVPVTALLIAGAALRLGRWARNRGWAVNTVDSRQAESERERR